MARTLSYLRAPGHGRLHRRRVRLRQGLHRARLPTDAAPALPAVVPGRGPRHRAHPGRRVARWSWPTTPAPSRSTRSMVQVAVHDEHPNHRHLRLLGADLVFQTPLIGDVARKQRLDAGRATPTPSGCSAAGSSSACSPRGSRAWASRSASATSCSGSVGAGSSAPRCARRPDHPVLGRRRRGDLPDPRATSPLWPGCSRAVLPHHPDLPLARAARADPAAEQVDHRVRRAGPDRRTWAGGGRRPDARVRPHRPGPRDHPADALLAAVPAQDRVLLAETDHDG